MKYRLETDNANPVNPRIVEDDNGVSFMAAQHELIRWYLVNANDHLRNAERVANEISDQIQRWESNER